MNVRLLTLSAISAALGTVILYIASILPTARLAVLCVSSLAVVIVYVRGGVRWAFGTFVTIAVLGLLLCPDKSEALIFTLFIGYYPIVKFLVERITKRGTRLLIKLAVFNAAFTVLILFVRSVVGHLAGFLVFVLVYLLANLVFLAYDFALKELVLFYLRRIDRRIK